MDIDKETLLRPADELPAAGAGVPFADRRTLPASLKRRTIRWLAELPAHVRPTEVAVNFPHVANRLAQLWSSAEDCSGYFDDLMHDRRGGRRGFPPVIAFELMVLKRHRDWLSGRSPQKAPNRIIC